VAFGSIWEYAQAAKGTVVSKPDPFFSWGLTLSNMRISSIRPAHAASWYLMELELWRHLKKALSRNGEKQAWPTLNPKVND
jgi:hypothetical protein